MQGQWNATSTASDIIDQLLSQAIDAIRLKHIESTLLPMCSKQRIWQLLRILIMTNEYDEYDAKNEYPYGQQNEPISLLSDNLIPTFTELGYRDTSLLKKEEGGIIKDIREEVEQKVQEYFIDRSSLGVNRLQIPQTLDDSITQSLRAKAEEVWQKRDIQSKQKRMQKQFQQKNNLFQQILKDSKGKYGYDYDGMIIPLKMEQRAHLIDRGIRRVYNDAVKITAKETKHTEKRKAISIKTGTKDSEEKKNLLKNTNSIASIINKPQKLSSNMNIRKKAKGKNTVEVEEKKNNHNKLQKKQQLLNRNIKAQSFTNLKLQPLKYDSKAQCGKPSAEQSTLQSSRQLLKKVKSTININNAQEHEYLLKTGPIAIDRLKTRFCKNEVNTLGGIDTYNMEYIRTMGAIDREGIGCQVACKLPKLSKIGSRSVSVFKHREKVKNINEIMRHTRRKFEDDLRMQ